ncbi:MAG: serine--tRNA ligase, partial [bacterium]
MLDIKLIRDNPGFVKQKLELRNEDVKVIDKILQLDKSRLELVHKTEGLKEIRNKVSDEIAVMKKNKEDASDKISEMKKVSEEIKMLDDELRKYDEDLDILMKYIPNLPEDSVPHGKSEKDNVEIKKWGDKKEFTFKVKDHIQIGKEHDILDFERGTKISGSGFPLYKG